MLGRAISGRESKAPMLAYWMAVCYVLREYLDQWSCTLTFDDVGDVYELGRQTKEEHVREGNNRAAVLVLRG
jgi:hypothetical protein